MKCPQNYLTKMQEVILFYNGLDVPTRQILDSKGDIPTKIAADAKVAIQEMTEYSQKWHNGTSRTRRPHYTKEYPLKEEGKALKEAYYTQFDAPFQQGGQYRATTLGFYQRNNENPSNQRASIKILEIQIGQMSKVLQERGFESLPRSTETNLRDHVNSISTTVEDDMTPIRHNGSSQYAVSAQQYKKKGSYGPQLLEANSYEASHIDNSIPRKEKDTRSFTIPCYINNVCFDNALADLGASCNIQRE
ncbi:hypothetical protein Tco_0538333 [Tanacetum coccineum]